MRACGELNKSYFSLPPEDFLKTERFHWRFASLVVTIKVLWLVGGNEHASEHMGVTLIADLQKTAIRAITHGTGSREVARTYGGW